ncbi:DUF222 domain-containing protein [Leucobacter albus]|uniref:DUF222 domain-containing protein n=1 Tax=Leucobacter albus TaxID=272210 RepID=A0ABW3TKA7_9MICO
MTSSGKFTNTQLAVIDASVSQIERCEAQKRRLDAEQLAALAAAMGSALDAAGGNGAERELAFRSLRFEVATALHESEYIAERMMNTAFLAQNSYPATLGALRGGEISMSHLRVITDEGAPIETGDPATDEQRRARYESAALAFAREETPNRLRPIARRLAAAHSDVALAERHETALQRRCVRVVPLEDGMADLIAHLPAEDAYAIKDRIQRLAKRALHESVAPAGGGEAAVRAGAAPVAFRGEAHGVGVDAGGGAGSVADDGSETVAGPGAGTGTSASTEPSAGTGRQAGAGQSRTAAVAGADVLRDLLLGETGEAGDAGAAGVASEAALGRQAVQAHIQVVIPADGPAELIGYGPLDDVTAARIAGESEAWERIRVDEAGDVLSVDRYRPSAEHARRLKARDLHCRAPGCRVPATRCDIDHTIDAARGGATSTANLAHLCRGHHTLKHHTDWTVRQEANGVMTWTSPTGRVHHDRPPSRVRFRRPEAADA